MSIRSGEFSIISYLYHSMSLICIVFIDLLILYNVYRKKYKIISLHTIAGIFNTLHFLLALHLMYIKSILRVFENGTTLSEGKHLKIKILCIIDYLNYVT